MEVSFDKHSSQKDIFTFTSSKEAITYTVMYNIPFEQ